MNLFSGNQSLKNRARDLLAKQKQLLDSSSINEESSGVRKPETALRKTRADSLRQNGGKDEPDVTSASGHLKIPRRGSQTGDYGRFGGNQMISRTS